MLEIENVTIAVFQQFQELTTTITTQHVEHPSVISVHGIKKKIKKKSRVRFCPAVLYTLYTPWSSQLSIVSLHKGISCCARGARCDLAKLTERVEQVRHLGFKISATTTTTTKSTSVDPPPLPLMVIFLQSTLSAIATGKQSLGTLVSASNRSTNMPACLPFAMFWFPQNQLTNSFISTPSAMTAEPKAPLSNYVRVPRKSCIKHPIRNALQPGYILRHSQHMYMPVQLFLLETVSVSEPSIYTGGPFQPLP